MRDNISWLEGGIVSEAHLKLLTSESEGLILPLEYQESLTEVETEIKINEINKLLQKMEIKYDRRNNSRKEKRLND